MKIIKFAPFGRNNPRGYVKDAGMKGFKYLVQDRIGLVCEGFSDTEAGAEDRAIAITVSMYDSMKISGL